MDCTHLPDFRLISEAQAFRLLSEALVAQHFRATTWQRLIAPGPAPAVQSYPGCNEAGPISPLESARTSRPQRASVAVPAWAVVPASVVVSEWAVVSEWVGAPASVALAVPVPVWALAGSRDLELRTGA